MAYGKVIEIKNIDKFKKEILSGDREEIMCHIAALRGHEEECDGFHCSECEANSIYWLCVEYEPPLLKNGDGLKPGDWIMVRTEGLCGWKKRKFMCYAEGRFFVLDYGESFKECATYSRWKQARLPNEDE